MLSVAETTRFRVSYAASGMMFFYQIHTLAVCSLLNAFCIAVCPAAPESRRSRAVPVPVSIRI